MNRFYIKKNNRALSFLSSTLIVVVIIAMMLGVSNNNYKSSAETSKFYFKNTMSEDVLRAYMSRAVTHQELCGGASYINPIIEEDIRMLLRTGTKFVGRAAMFAWSGTSLGAIESHFKDAKEKAALVHKADPEIILQAGLFEIVRKDYVKNIVIPSWVFEAFGKPAETRSFNYDEITEGNPSYWGDSKTGLPNITNIETQMWFYYWGCRYIDIGFEGLHLGQAELMAGNKKANYTHWETVTNKLRTYAKKNARRGIVLIDAHSSIASEGMKVGNRLILDVQAAGIVPAETVNENGVLKCKIGHYQDPDCSYQWIGRSAGGIHPLGFTIEKNITILEFDNHGNSGNKGKITKNGHFNWGYDDITWFAMQPESYRNEFLLTCDNYLKTTKKILDSKGQQVYFLQPAMRRVLTPYKPDYPQTIYTPGENFNGDFMLDYLAADEYSWNNGKVNILNDLDNNKYMIENIMIYRANRNSDGCPNGFNQEDTIRQIFLGKNAPENPAYTKVILPAVYTKSSSVTTKSTASSSNSKGTTQLNNKKTDDIGSTNSQTSDDLSDDTGSTSFQSDNEISDNTDSTNTSSSYYVSDTSKTTQPKKISKTVTKIFFIVLPLIITASVVAFLLYRKHKPF